MIKRLFIHSFRALNRQKGYVFINLSGLSIGIACSLIIALFIIHELSYDKFNDKKDRIYRVILNGKIGGQELNVSSTASPIGPTMAKEFPEVEDYTRTNIWSETTIKYYDQSFTENGFVEADSSFFSIFTLPLIKGNKKTVLNAPHTVVLSETTARKIFGKTDPIDKLLKIGTDTILYRITGIMADVPETMHFNANIVGSFMTNNRANDNQWLSNSFNTYLLLRPNTSPEQVNTKTVAMLKKYVGPELQKFIGASFDEFIAKGNKYRMYLQPLTDIHTNPSIQHDAKPATDPKYLLIFGSIALLIIVIAAINFMNLSTAQASKRAKEVGMKKVSGSSRGMLIGQFLTESFLMAVISLFLAVVIIAVSLPYFNNLLQTKLTMNYFSDWRTIPLLIAITLFIGLLAGSYPAFFLSSFSPFVVLKGKLKNSMKNGQLRRVLVVLQFSISIVLIVGTLIMFRQIQFMLKKDLGFNKEQLMVITRAESLGTRVKAFKDALTKIPGVIKSSASTAVPGRNNNNNGYMMEGRADESFLLQTNWVDYDYFDTYGIKLSSGRFFSESMPTDKDGCIVNESTTRKYNITNPSAASFKTSGDKPDSAILMPIIGVVKNFHFESLQNEITPYMFRFKNERNNWGYYSVRISPMNTNATIKEIETVWKEFTANDPIQYFFMDQDFSRMYKQEKQSAQLSILFSILAIFIASLGLFGLTSFTVEQRTKEIGVRKALGASIANIFYLISREIMILVSISALIAWPLIYYVARNWLQNYYYRINLRAGDFLIGFAIAITIALITISYRTIRAARVNPVVSLRYE
jgi:putative ABC transport system permease protein